MVNTRLSESTLKQIITPDNKKFSDRPIIIHRYVNRSYTP